MIGGRGGVGAGAPSIRENRLGREPSILIDSFTQSSIIVR